jgi:renalase
MKDLVCIGAGIAGSLLCHLLKDHFDLLLLDKARGPGGRMSTRRVEVDGREYRFDHGAQFMTLRDKRLKEILARPLELGVIKVWHSAIPHSSYPEVKESPRFCGSTGMNSLAQHFSTDVECRFNWKCAKVTFEKTHWRLLSSEGETLECKMLVLATPLPQSLDLMASLGMGLQALSEVRYFPTWAVMFGARDCFQLPFPHAQWLRPETGIEWICDNHKKGISKNPSLTVHLTQEQSLKMLNASPEDVIEFSKSRLQGVLPKDLCFEAAHRWLYSQAAPFDFDTGFFHVRKPASVFFIGDVFRGGRVEGAALSAIETAEEIKRSLG